MNMDGLEAEREVRELGIAYFNHGLDKFSIDKIIEQIRSEIADSQNPTELGYAEVTRQALARLLQDRDEELLDDILVNDFDLSTGLVNGSVNFFQRLYNAYDGEIKAAKKRI
jgi:hypothetical protein